MNIGIKLDNVNRVFYANEKVNAVMEQDDVEASVDNLNKLEKVINGSEFLELLLPVTVAADNFGKRGKCCQR